jgi:hypothetical protein
MKKSLYLLLILGIALVYACTRKTESSKPVTKLMTHKEAVDTLRGSNQDKLKPLEYSVIDKVIFDTLDVSNLLCDTDSANAQYGKRFDGFYGKDNYRIEMYFASVTKDPKRPNVYLVKGKSHFKKNISPFEGEIVFEKSTLVTDPNMTELGNIIDDEGESKTNLFVSCVGDFLLKEDSLSKGSGVFSGKINLDFFRRKNGNIELWFFSPETKTQGGGFKFEGNWTSYKTGTQKPVLWAKDLFAFANDILKDFSIGEREVEINPKYRHLGWDKYWENDEWWNESKPTPTIQ